MGMTDNQVRLIRAIAENKYEEAKKIAIACCTEDTTKKNSSVLNRYKQILQSGSVSAMQLPPNISTMATLEDVSNFREDRYYLSEREEELFRKISGMHQASLKLMELGIPYVNAVLLTGTSGTGKTTFGRYAAFRLGLPYMYVNFSYLVESYLGKTGQNLRNIMQFARRERCLLMLDEIDAIAQKRAGGSEGPSREYSNVTITLLQELDQVRNDSLILAATNIPDVIDKAVVRRFPVKHKIETLSCVETLQMVRKYLSTVPFAYSEDEAKMFAHENAGQPQAVIINRIIEAIMDPVLNGGNEVRLI